jgi:ribosome maturation factor RimP
MLEGQLSRRHAGVGEQDREWAPARFFCVRTQKQPHMTALQTEIEERLAHSEPEIEVLLAEVLGGRCLRVFIDHPEGVNLAMCERVTVLLTDLRERYSLEVSSPGSERPLTKPAHFRRFVGRRARVRMRHPRTIERPVERGQSGAHDGEQRSEGQAKTVVSLTGELVGASEEEITLAADGGVIAIPYSEIRRSNLIEE